METKHLLHATVNEFFQIIIWFLDWTIFKVELCNKQKQFLKIGEFQIKGKIVPSLCGKAPISAEAFIVVVFSRLL